MAKIIKNEQELFDLFVEEKNSMRPTLETPFIEEYDKRVWASEGHILIMVNKECVTGEYEIRKMGNTLPVWDFNCNYDIPISELEKVIEKCPKEPEVLISYKEKKCPECDGEGEVEVEYYAHSDNKYHDISGKCPICGGLGTINEEIKTKIGKMIMKEDSVIEIKGGYLKSIYIKTLIKACKMLDIDSVKLLRVSHNYINIFALNDDIHIVLMPLYLGEEEDRYRREEAVKLELR